MGPRNLLACPDSCLVLTETLGLDGIMGYSSWSRVMAVELTLCIFPLLHFTSAAGKTLISVPKIGFAEHI